MHGAPVEVMEGEWPGALVVIEFPSLAAAHEWYDSPAYREILRLRARLNEIYVKHTGQPLEVIASAVERDRFLTPLEAKEFGLVDEVVEARPTTIEERARA